VEDRLRIVSLLPSSTEIVYALGLGDALVGVTHECDFPPAARALPAVTSSGIPSAATPGEIDRHVRASVHAGSSLYALDANALAALRPTLVLTQELCAVCAVDYATVAGAVRRANLDPRVLSLEPTTLAAVLETIATIGDVCGVPETAARVVSVLAERLAALAARARPVRPRTLVLEWTDPPMGGGHWTPELVRIAGGEPILAVSGGRSSVLAWEAVAAADPDVVLVAPCGFALPAALEACRALADHPTWRQLRAVRAGRAYAIDGNAYVNRPGPRLVETAEIFASAIDDSPTPAGASDPQAYRRLDAVGTPR